MNRGSAEREQLFLGRGELAALMQGFDWQATPLGPPEYWPNALKTAVRIMLTSQQPIWIGWGSELIYLYNDPYKSIIGGKHPWALGRPTSVVWSEIWGDIGPMLDTAMRAAVFSSITIMPSWSQASSSSGLGGLCAVRQALAPITW